MTETTITTPSWVQALDKYVASKPIEDVAADLGLKPEEIIMLVANENPNGMSSKVKEAVATAALNLNRYPDADAYHLQKAIAEKYGVPQDWVVIGSGSSELLGLAAETVLSEGTTAIYPQYSFSLYPMVARLCGAETIEIPSTGDFNADLDAMADAVDERTRLIFLTNPNNPTGTYLAEKDILDFLDKVPPTVMVLFDEAYVEFLEPALRCDSMEIVRLHPNVMIARTFSKAYGLAGARVGYGIAQPGLLSMLNRVRHPFNVNDLSQIAALAALKDQDFVEMTLEVNRKGIKFLSEAFDALKLPYMGLHANFITVKVGPHADDIVQCLLKKGIIVRRMKSYDLPEWIRVSVGTPEQNERFLEVLKEALIKFGEKSA
ncbi:histidinol-phosphate transaminase [Parasutterella sp.]|uniref:histidinol-phosphate transaminase n=1 Tax=Parasutterella sp. TaxID=2049037 RepID=UPI0030770595